MKSFIYCLVPVMLLAFTTFFLISCDTTPEIQKVRVHIYGFMKSKSGAI